MRDTTGGTRVEEELRARVRQQAAIADLGQRALARTELPALMDEAVAVVARTLDVEYSKVLELLPGGQALLLRAGVGWKDGGVGHATVGAGRDSQAGYTLSSREPVIVQDLRTETRFTGPPLLNDHGVVSGMSVIIHGATGPYGVLGAHTTSLRTFTPDDVHFLRAVANILAMAIERRAAEEGLRESEARYRMLVETTDEVIYRVATTEQEPAGGTVQFVSRQVERILGYRPDEFMEDPGLWYRILHADDWPAVMEATQRMFAERAPMTRLYRLRHKETGEYRWLEDRVVPQTDEHGTVIAIQGAARDVTERKRAEETAGALVHVGHELAGTLDPAQVARLVLSTVLRLLGVRRASFYQLDPASGGLSCVAAAGEGDTAGWLGETLSAGQGIAGRAVAERRPVWSADLLADPRVTLPAWLSERIREDGHRAVVAVPLIARGDALGALILRDRAGRVFTDEDLRLLSAFADQAALALENARLYEEADRRRCQAEALAELARLLTESLDVATVGDRIMESVTALLGGPMSFLGLLDPDGSLRSIGAGGRSNAHFGPGYVAPAGTGLVGRAVTEGRPVWSRDVLTDPAAGLTEDQRRRNAEAGVRAVLAVPLRVRGEVIGALAIDDYVERAFSDAEVELLQHFADQAALALENARLYEQARRQQREAEVVAELARGINASLDFNTVLERVVGVARELCTGDSASIALREAGSPAAVIRYHLGTRYQGYPALRIKPGLGLGGQVLLSGRPARTDNYAEDPRAPADYLPAIREEALGALVVVPIRLGGAVEGLLYVGRRSPRPFTDQDEALLLRLADHAAIAIQNARLFGESGRQRRAAEALAEVGRLLSQSIEPREVERRIVDSVRDLLGVEAAVMIRVEPTSGKLVATAAAGDAGPLWQQGRHVPAGTGAIGLALHEGRLVASSNTLDDPRLTFLPDARAALEETPIRAVLALPLAVKGSIVGVLGVGDRTGRVFAEEEVRVAQAFADQAALALENARLFDETRERLQETRTLLAVGRALSLNVPVLEGIRQAAREVAGAFGADMVGVYTLDPGKGVLVPIAGYRVPKDMFDTIARTPFPIARLPFLQEAWATRRAVWTADYRSDPRFDQDFLGALRPRSLLFAPTQVGGEIVGGLFLVWWSRERTQTPAELRLVEGVAGLVGQALERARAGDALRQSEERFRGAFEHSGIGRSLQALDGRYLRVNRTLGEMLGYSAEELMATRWQAVTDPRDIAPDLELEAKLRGGQMDSYQIVKRYIQKRGHVLWAISTVSLVRDSEGQPAHFVAEAQDITARKHAEEALRRHHERLRILHEIDRAILAARSGEAIAQAALRGLQQLVPCDRASVVLFDFEVHEAVTLAVEVTGETRLRAGNRFPLETFFDLEALRTGTVSVVEDTLAIPAPARALATLMAEGIRSYVAVPLLSQGVLIGALNLAARAPGTFLAEQKEIAREVAGSLTVAIQDARLFAQVRAGRERLQTLSRRLVEVQETERRHLARELHDEIGQVLTGLKLTLDIKGQSAAHLGQAEFEEARTLVSDLIVRVRDLSLQLRPAMLDDLGLAPALVWLFGRYTVLTRVEVKFEHRGLERRFPPEAEIGAYRIVQEALTNVARHAGVREVTVRVWVDEDALHAQVEDMGAGFDARVLGVAGSSSGLAGMRERAELLGGRLTVDSRPGAGTRLWAELPLADRLDRREKEESGDDHRPRG